MGVHLVSGGKIDKAGFKAMREIHLDKAERGRSFHSYAIDSGTEQGNRENIWGAGGDTVVAESRYRPGRGQRAAVEAADTDEDRGEQ